LIVCPVEADSLLARERDAFQALYPDARFSWNRPTLVRP
jgi:hypothetical protein